MTELQLVSKSILIDNVLTCSHTRSYMVYLAIILIEMKKTFKQWAKQDKDLNVFLCPGDYIDERLYNYIADIIPPAYCSRDLMQGCDAIKNEGDVLYYITVYRTDDNQYLYLGVLPEFKQ